MTILAPDLDRAWPDLPLYAWKDTYATLHMYAQIVGKIALAATPLTNHWWNAALSVTPHGLATSTLTSTAATFSMELDFVEHRLTICVANGGGAMIPLEPRSVAAFYDDVMRTLRRIGIDVDIWTRPVEVPHPIRFEEDVIHRAYDAQRVGDFHRALLAMKPVFDRFRADFLGKSSPVHFFWGSFDLCVTRFSGRRAPARPLTIDREAYSHEVISAGFWPGNADGPVREPAFYAYAAPEPHGFRACVIDRARYDERLGIFVLPYETVRTAPSPSRLLRKFLQQTYDAAAWLADWDRASLERFPGALLAEQRAQPATPDDFALAEPAEQAAQPGAERPHQPR